MEGRKEGRTDLVLKQLKCKLGSVAEESRRQILWAVTHEDGRMSVALLNAMSIGEATNCCV